MTAFLVNSQLREPSLNERERPISALDEIAELYDPDLKEDELLLVDDELVDDTVVPFPAPEPIVERHWGLLPDTPKKRRRTGLLDFGLK